MSEYRVTIRLYETDEIQLALPWTPDEDKAHREYELLELAMNDDFYVHIDEREAGADTLNVPILHSGKRENAALPKGAVQV